MVRSLLVVCLAFAGVLLLAGVGWALVAAAVLVLVFWPAGVDDRLAAVWRAAGGWLRSSWRRVRVAPRRPVAVGGMTAGMVAAPAGFGVAWGTGAGLIAAGVALIGLALLTGWNTA